MRRIITIAFLIIYYTAVSAQEDTAIKPVVYPSNYSAQLNVVYTKVGDWMGA